MVNLAGGKYNNGKYEFEVDYTKGVKKVFTDKLGNTNKVFDTAKLKNITHTIEFQIPEHGKKKLTDKQVEIFHKINLNKATSSKRKTLDQLSKWLNIFCTANVDMTKKPPAWKPMPHNYEKSKTAAFTIMADKYLEEGSEQIEKNIINTLKQYAKGKVRRRRIIAQGVKHGVKPVLGVVAVPVGIALSATGLGAPIGILATKSGIVSIKQSFDFFSGRYRSLDKLEASIISNTKVVQKKANTYAEAIEAGKQSKTPKQQAEADKARGKIKAKIKVTEVNAIALQEFFAVHKKSINNLSYLVGKYEKKMNELNYAAMRMGKKIDQCKTKVAKAEKENKERRNSIKELKKNAAKYNLSDKQAERLIRDIDNELNKEETAIKKINDSMGDLDSTVDEKVDKFLKKDRKFQEWKSELEAFKEIRPKTLKRWKNGIKALSIIESFAGTAMGGSSDAIGGIETALDITLAAVYNTEDAVDKVTDLHGKLKNCFKK